MSLQCKDIVFYSADPRITPLHVAHPSIGLYDPDFSGSETVINNILYVPIKMAIKYYNWIISSIRWHRLTRRIYGVEEFLFSRTKWAIAYCASIKIRIPEIESRVIKTPLRAVQWAQIWGIRLPEAEKLIMPHPRYAVRYAMIFHMKFEEFGLDENQVLPLNGSLKYAIRYAVKIRGRWDKLENEIIKRGDLSLANSYHKRVIGRERWHALEELFSEHKQHDNWKQYCRRVKID